MMDEVGDNRGSFNLHRFSLLSSLCGLLDPPCLTSVLCVSFEQSEKQDVEQIHGDE